MLFKSIFISSTVTSALAIYLPEDHYLAKAPAIQEGSCNCSGDNVRYNKTLASDYICGDKRLGPSRLPTKLPLGTFVTGYDRFGGLSPNDFLGKWYNSTQGPDGREAGWIYPEKYGFHLDEEKLPVKSNIDLMPGTLVDRFGYNTGRYISPATAPFAQRALHPQNLDNDINKEFPNNYHVYNVTRMFTVQAGPIRPWFGQPGFGVQFFLGNGINVKDYLDNGHLVELKPSDLVKDKTGCGFQREDDEAVSDEL